MNDVEKILNDYYEEHDEDSRLIKDKAHQIEFLTTTRYIDKYLKKGDRILEVGAGTGRYSIHYASKGYQLDSVELVKKNLEILKSKITSDMNIKAVQGNCMNLDMYEDNTFDITLILGPLYHLYDEEDINKAILEAIRVTKTNGKIFIAYLTDDSIILSYGVRKRNIKRLQEMCDENWSIPKLKEEIFASYKIDEFDNMIKQYPIKQIETIMTDGIATNVPEFINSLNDEEFEIYLDYHFKNCNRKDLMGYSSHILGIIEKK